MSDRGENVRRAQSAGEGWTALFGGNPTEEEKTQAVAYVAADASERRTVQKAQRILRSK
jgi:hypothetical protein